MAREDFMLTIFVLSSLAMSTSAFNITKVLEPYPNFSQFNQWLSKTGVVDEVNNRTSITVLAPADDVLNGYISGVANAWNDPGKVADTLRYHILLTYYGINELKTEVRQNGTAVTTLLQTTGRANETQGFVTLYSNGTVFLVGHEHVDSFGNETILGNVTALPYEYSILQVSSILTPVPPSPPAPASAPSPTVLKAPVPAPVTAASAPIDSKPGPAGPGNHANVKSISKPLVLIAMLLAFGLALP